MSDAVTVPLDIRICLLHGYLQLLAEQIGVDLLHVKGAAVHPALSRNPRSSVDVDVLVRPAHVDVFTAALHARGWSLMTGFEAGSAFGHAMNLRHDLGMVDVHRSWPGFEIDPTEAFELLWARHELSDIAHVACPVPDLACQRLILLLHFGRSGGQRAADRDVSWTDATPQDRIEVRALAEQFDAEVALAAAVGELEHYRGDPTYRLWRHFSRGDTGRLDEWSGRWQAARGPGDKWRVARGFVRVNDDLLSLDLGRPPTWRDYAGAYRERVVEAARDLRRLASTRARRRSR